MKRTLFLSAAIAVGAVGVFAGTSLAQPGDAGPRGHHGSKGGMISRMLHAADANDDKSVTRAEIETLRGEMFDWMDRNGDEAIDDQDRSPMHRRLAAKSDGEAPRSGGHRDRRRMESADVNDDGRIDRSEFLGAPMMMFDELDVNDDDVVSPDEIDAAHDMHRRTRQWWRED